MCRRAGPAGADDRRNRRRPAGSPQGRPTPQCRRQRPPERRRWRQPERPVGQPPAPGRRCLLLEPRQLPRNHRPAVVGTMLALHGAQRAAGEGTGRARAGRVHLLAELPLLLRPTGKVQPLPASHHRQRREAHGRPVSHLAFQASPFGRRAVHGRVGPRHEVWPRALVGDARDVQRQPHRHDERTHRPETARTSPRAAPDGRRRQVESRPRDTQGGDARHGLPHAGRLLGRTAHEVRLDADHGFRQTRPDG